jgi:hypothetical protein
MEQTDKHTIANEIEDTEIEFADIIENQMSEDEFWAYVRTWLDTEGLIEQMLEWDIEDKVGLINEWKAKTNKLMISEGYEGRNKNE